MTSPRIEVVSASGFSLEELTALFNRGFEGYVFPVKATVDVLAQRLRTEDVDLAASKVGRMDGQPAGLALLARRGCRSRLAAMGVAPEARRHGLGRLMVEALVAEARSRHGAGDRELRLEVFEANFPAPELYTRLGFAPHRRLVGRTCLHPRTLMAKLELHDTPVWTRATSFEAADLPWQLEPETLATLGAPARVACLEGQAWALIYGTSSEMLVLRGLFVAPAQRRQGLATRLLGALAAMHPGHALHFPPLLPEAMAAEFFQCAGFQVDAMNQVEMCLPFS